MSRGFLPICCILKKKNMSTISKEQFRELAAVEGAFCVSFYLPTHRAGVETLNKEDALAFKNQLKQVSEELIRQGMSSAEAERFLQPAVQLRDDTLFWRHQEEGLAVFMKRDFLEYYKLPFSPRPYIYVSNEFYLKPLVPAFTGNGHFYVLGLNLHHVTFYEGNREELWEINVEDVVPQRLEEVVGEDYRERSLQLHSQRGAAGTGAMFHGRGEWKGEFRKEEILQFFRAIDKGLRERMENTAAPLLVAGVNYLFPIYQEANTYKPLLEEHISQNPEDLSLKDLHHQAWLRVYPYFDRERKDKLERYGHAQETPRTSFEIEEIIPAAMAGRVDTLFLDEGAEVWGVYDPGAGKVTVHEEQKTINTELLNLVAKAVLLRQGRVFLQSRATLPQPFSPVNALYRY